MNQTNPKLLIDLEKLGGAGYRGADRIRMLDAEVLGLEMQLAAYRKSEPEHQAQMKWAREIVSNVVIPPDGATTFKGHKLIFTDGPDWTDKEGVIHKYKCGLNPDPNAMKHMVNYCTCSQSDRGTEHG